VNGEWISEHHFVRGIQLLRQKVMSVKEKGTFSPTYFELMTALALYHFSEMQVDYVVLETGMGGRLDSTNIVDSKVQVITNIDLEHTRYLGKTVQEIAREKSGIIKPLSPVITGATGVALEVIEKYSLNQGSHLIRLNHELQFELRSQSLEGQSVVISTHRGHYDAFLKLLGRHQAENSALAIGAIESLERLEIHIDKNTILRGLEKARWPGRFEILRQKPLVILDAAHNPRAAQVLIETWHDYFGKEKARIIFSALEDKDIDSMAKTLSEIAENVTLIELSHRRGLKLDRLQEVWGNYLPKKRVRVSSAKQAFPLIQEGNTAQRPILITGSIYLLGEILKEVNPLRGLEDVRQQNKIQ
jgi:dihydrofolate synthase/folylpolyglutamate synthase